jgi:hypothetical protein
MNDLLEDMVRNDIRCHRENGVSLNPYSTDLARNAWQRGFDGAPQRTGEWVDCYRRGQLAAQLIKEQA